MIPKLILLARVVIILVFFALPVAAGAVASWRLNIQFVEKIGSIGQEPGASALYLAATFAAAANGGIIAAFWLIADESWLLALLALALWVMCFLFSWAAAYTQILALDRAGDVIPFFAATLLTVFAAFGPRMVMIAFEGLQKPLTPPPAAG